MTGTDLNNELQRLETIQSVDVPAFLFTRVQQRIQNESFGKVTPKIKWALAFSIIVLFVINLLAISSYHSTQDYRNNLAKAMQLLPNNNFYND
ncbi:hypothetical protein [Aurantibacillus circumpalustris]|uniref:hypothetical protein n=1 Tax=Aurantibacillus circumpalustris TaxID=3036359 RepID=UPI00295AF023|nr:hypothetical protein [Aurantibacillus circumpalustris]